MSHPPGDVFRISSHTYDHPVSIFRAVSRLEDRSTIALGKKAATILMYTKPGSDGLQFLDDIVYYRLSYGERRADQHSTLVRIDQSYGVVGGFVDRLRRGRPAAAGGTETQSSARGAANGGMSGCRDLVDLILFPLSDPEGSSPSCLAPWPRSSPLSISSDSIFTFDLSSPSLLLSICCMQLAAVDR